VNFIRTQKIFGAIVILFSILILSAFNTDDAGSVADMADGEYDMRELFRPVVLPLDTPRKDSLAYPFKDNGYELPVYNQKSPLFLKTPGNIKSDVEYDIKTGQYVYKQKLGDKNYRPELGIDGQEYQNIMFKKNQKDYFRTRIKADNIAQQKTSLVPKLQVNSELFERVFGGNTIEIRPTGAAEVGLGFKRNTTNNPSTPLALRKQTTPDFDMNIQLSATAKIGEKVQFTTNYNTQAQFTFENQLKLGYQGKEDEIIKSLEFGNINMPLNTTLITGANSLFGVKTQLQFGKLKTTIVLSEQKGKKTTVEVAGGAQTQPFNVAGDNYDANRHFFLNQYFRDNFERWVGSAPVLNSPVKITKIEVYILNRTASTDQLRNVFGLSDIGEDVSKIIPELTGSGGTPYLPITDNPNFPDIRFPDNNNNSLYLKLFDTLDGYAKNRNFSNVLGQIQANSQQFIQGRDYDYILSARKLKLEEFKFNDRLGYISLNNQLNYDEILCVSYQYTINGKTYQVGEFSDEVQGGNNFLITKLLKSSIINTKIPLWDLMMKNIYSLGAYQVNKEDFKLDIYYNNPTTGVDIPYLPEGTGIVGKQIIRLIGADTLNVNNDKTADGYFDFIPGITINPQNGQIIFPRLEPFGSGLRRAFLPEEQSIATKFVFQELYDSTRIAAMQIPQKNRFKIKGSYKSSVSNEIQLGAVGNIPEGSVVVTAGGLRLTENVDYKVDYSLGRVTILNQGILSSGQPVKVETEGNALFNVQQRNLIGARFDYQFNKDWKAGGTVMRYSETPASQKVAQGDESMANTILGTDVAFQTDVPIITKLIDKLPFISTKEKSSINFNGEVAALLPGVARATRIGGEPTSYLDDFEYAIYSYDIKGVQAWSHASIPQFQTNLFPEAGFTNDYRSGYNRAKFSWYSVDDIFQEARNETPTNVSKELQYNLLFRRIVEQDIFPTKVPPNNIPNNLRPLDLAFFPEERGIYNYDSKGFPGISKGIAADGKLKNPESRWGGIMRRVDNSDFQLNNVEYIQFWMMDPYNEDYQKLFGNGLPQNGELLIHLGNVSEDVVKDNRMSYENGLPGDNVNNAATDTIHTKLAAVPSAPALVNVFDNNDASRVKQDVGFDGYNNDDERIYFKPYLDSLQTLYGTSSAAYAQADGDPSGDDYHFFRGDDYDQLQNFTTADRYKKFNGLEGNSPTNAQDQQRNSGGYSTSFSVQPSIEDVNRDNTLNTVESYYQYKMSLSPNDLNPSNVGNNFIQSIQKVDYKDDKGVTKPVNFYQIRIPITAFQDNINNIEGFNSIRFMRMIVKGFDKPVILRMARMEFVRSEWRRYPYNLSVKGDYIADDDAGTQVEVGAVNLQENGAQSPVNYVIPPTIQQQVNYTTTTQTPQNEQALLLGICNLRDGDAKAIYKNLDIDLRSYKKIKMFAHAHSPSGEVLNDDDLNLFVRLGPDFNNNYYEYEVPLKLTPNGSSYDNGNEADRAIVWPSANEVEIDFEKLYDLKQQRSVEKGYFNYSEFANEYETDLGGGRKLRVVGNPNLATVRTVMIGIRNPKDGNGQSKCAQIWVNELRLTGIDNRAGWASLASTQVKLADLGTLNLAGGYSTPGFGSVEKKVSERSRATTANYDASTNLTLNKLLPKWVNLNLPAYAAYGETFITPLFNPLDPDIELKKTLGSDLNAETKTNIREKAIDYTKRRSVNFTNVKFQPGSGKGAKKPKPWDISNVAVSYAFNDVFKRSINVEKNLTINHTGNLNYNFSNNAKSITPFGKMKIFQSKSMAFIKDFNFSLAPSRVGFSANVIRSFNEFRNRDITSDENLSRIIPSLFNKQFNLNRTFDMQYKLSKGITFDFNSANDSRILEPNGRIDTKAKKDIVMKSVRTLGSNTSYRHSANVNVAIPINKLPYLDFTTATYRLGTTYLWTRGPYSLRSDDTKAYQDSIGNVIQNSNAQKWDLQLSMTTLYNKIPFIKKALNRPTKEQEKANKLKVKPAAETVKPDLQIKEKGKEKEKGVLVPDTAKKKKNENLILRDISDATIRILTSLKSASMSYTNNQGLTMPGFVGNTKFGGLDLGNNFSKDWLGFAFGQQKDVRGSFAKDSLLIRSGNNAFQYLKNVTQNFNYRASLEPLKEFKIDLTANKQKSNNQSSFNGYDSLTRQYQFNQSKNETGNINFTIVNLNGALKSDGDILNSKSFAAFLQERKNASRNFGTKNGSSGGIDSGDYNDGYNALQPEVLIAAFNKTYAGFESNTNITSILKKFPLPNWNVTYSGLNKIKLVQKLFKNLTLSHGYKSIYTVGSYVNNLDFNDNNFDGFSDNRVRNGNNFVSEYQVTTVGVTEQFSPLVRIDMQFNGKKNAAGPSFNAEVRKDKRVDLILAGQINETKATEYVFGFGYRIPNVSFGKLKIGNKKVQSDLNTKLDFSVRDNYSVVRQINTENSVIANGSKYITLTGSADYQLTSNLQVRANLNHIVNAPKTSQGFRNSNTSFMIYFRFLLGQ
jgi:cell surface protein SprA